MSANTHPSGFCIFIHVSITFGIIFLSKLAHSNVVPDEIIKAGQYQPQSDSHSIDAVHEQQLLQQLIYYSQHDNLVNAHNIDVSSYSDISQFKQQNEDQLLDIYAANEETCRSLGLESSECYEDCIYYISPLSLLADNSTDNGYKIQNVLSWYQMGGGPVGWYEIGNQDMCQYMDGTYCWTPIQIIQGPFTMNIQEHGCCVPGTCIGDDAVKVLKNNSWCYQGYDFTYRQTMYFGMFNITNTCEPIPRDLTNAGFCIVVTVFFMFVICVIIASVRTQQLMELKEKYLEISYLKNMDITDGGDGLKNMDITENKSNKNVYDDHWFLYSFSIQNLWKLFTRKRPADKSQFNFLDGIRVASMSWVIWGHVYVYFLMSSPSNQAVLMPFDPNAKQYDYVFTQFYMMIAEYGFYSVDSFFYLAGFLAAFSIYRQLKNYGDKAIKMFYIWIPISYINRILRLWPMMIFILFVQWYVADQLPYGYRVTSRDVNNDLCKDSWYKVIFFYANLESDMDDLGCMGHLWYIQCDMQMFIFLPWIILLFKWNKFIGLITSLLPYLGGIAVRTYFAIRYHFGANFLYPANEAINDGDQQQQYFKPWTRMSPYFIGVFTMLLILTLQEKKFKKFEIKSRYIFIAIMCFSCFIYCCLVFWPYEDVKDAPAERWSLLSNQIYYALSRPSWGAALGIMSFALVFKSKTLKSIIGTLLSVEIYQPLGKLTYTMYLIHWMILSWFFADLSISTYYEFWWILGIFFAIWMVTMFLTIILWFTMEQPMANLVGLGMKTLMKSFSTKKTWKSKKSIDAELTNIVKQTMVLKKQNNTNGHNILDKLLIDTNDQSKTLSEQTNGSLYGIGGSYESFVDTNNQNNSEYESIKSN